MSPTHPSPPNPAWAILSLFLLLSHLPPALSQLSIPLTFYTDNSCADPSTENASFSAKINVCIVTTGLGSASFPTTPCTSGDVLMLGYSDSTCTTSIDIYKDNNCIAPIRGDVAAIIVTCNQENDSGTINVTPTATTTVPVGPVAGSAAATSAVANGAQPTPSPTGGSALSSPFSGLSTKAIIAIAVGIGVPFLLLLFGVRNKRATGSFVHVTRHHTETTTTTMQQYYGP